MQNILNQLKLKADIVATETNGTVIKYFLKLQPGAKVSKIENCATEIAIGAKAYGKPIIRILPEQGLVCIELLSKPVNDVLFKDIPVAENAYGIPVVLGKTHDGKDLVVDLCKAPHLLIAGATGTGKSVMLHSVISSLIMHNDNVKLALVDPKQVELSYYSNIEQLLYPVIIEPQGALDVLSDLIEEMEQRFSTLRSVEVNNIQEYNKLKHKKMPYIVLVIDEFSDLMSSCKKEFQERVCTLAQKSRASGVHIIISTQRPDVKVISGSIKANFPARISCKVSSAIDSRVILDKIGADRLLGRGDSLINYGSLDLVRFQGAFISVDEIKQLCEQNKRQKKLGILNFFKGLKW